MMMSIRRAGQAYFNTSLPKYADLSAPCKEKPRRAKKKTPYWRESWQNMLTPSLP